MESVFLFGSSGHALVVHDALRSQKIALAGYFDSQPSSLFNEVKWWGIETDVDLKAIVGEAAVFPAIGSNKVREKLMELAKASSIAVLTVIHERAIISPTAEIESGTLVCPGAVVNALARIGKGCIINTSAVIEHECVVGDYTHIAPGAVLAGNVTVGKRTFIGAGVVVRQGIHIGSDVVIGAGAVVVSAVPDGETWVGNPARKVEKQQ